MLKTFSKNFSIKTLISLFIFSMIVLFTVAKISMVFAQDITPPSVPTGLIAVAVSSSQVNLTWNSSTDDVGVTGYNVYENGNPITTTTNNSYYVSGLNASTPYSFTVAAYDAAGNTSAQSTGASVMTTSVLPPTAPTLTITTVSPTQINLSWTASVSSVGVVGYYVYENSSKIATTTNTFYSINALSLATTYNFAVAAYDTLGNVSDQSMAVILTTQNAPTNPNVVVIPMPTNLIASPVSSSQIDLTWTAPADSFGITGYNVYENGAQIITTANTYFAVNSLTAGTSYSFTLAAYDAAGDTSVQSVSASATTQSVVPVTTSVPTPTPVVVLPTPTIISNTTPASIPGCTGTNSFSITTGQSCGTNNSTNSTTAFKFTLLLKKGSSSNEVLELQKFLNNAGYNCGTPDGKFGSKTKTALIDFQVANNLKGDGIAGAMTRVALNK